MIPIRVLIADDHPMLRAGLRTAVEAQADMTIVGEASDGNEAIELALAHHPDVVIIDISMPGMGGLESTKIISKRLDSVGVLALTMHETGPVLRSFLAAGGTGYVLKKSAGTSLLKAIRSVAKGRRYLDPRLGEGLLEELMLEGKLDHPGTADLSQRESEVLRLLALGYANQQIAQQMAISVKTVESYRARIGSKLGLKTRPEIVKYALANRILTHHESMF